jgi:two-component system phosphate regulon sensor histidine kinase PhoR
LTETRKGGYIGDMFAKNSFKIYLISSYIIIITVSFGLTAFVLDRILEADSLRDIKSSLIIEAMLIENQIPPDSIIREDLDSLDALVKNLGSKIKRRLTIIDGQGRVLADSEESREEVVRMPNHRNRPEVQTALTGRVGIDSHYSSVLKMDMLYVAVPIKDNDRIVGMVRLALPLDSVSRRLSAIRRVIFFASVFAIACAFVLGSLLSSRTIRPINRIIQISRKYSEGDFSHRILQSSNDEMGELAATLNKMAQDIESKIREIKTQNQKLEAIFNSMIEGVIVVDKTTRIVSVNPAIEKAFGIVNKDVAGMTLLEAIRNNDIAEAIDASLRTMASISTETTLIHPERRIFEITATPIPDRSAAAGSLVVIHDITEMRRLETVRSDFVANVSHELKTPLTSIKGFVETLLEGALEDREHNRTFLKIIQNHAERLNHLVDDLLSLSHLESGEIKLERKYFNIRLKFEEIVSGFKSPLTRMNIRVKNELPADLSIMADEDKMEHVLINLIDNAIKFNKVDGSIRIYSRDLNGEIEIGVEDTGIGIADRDISRVFERFYRVDKARSRELGGTGLGLSIVKHIVELHHGSVGVESTEGVGSRFWFILPR